MNKLSGEILIVSLTLIIFIFSACSESKSKDTKLPESKPTDFNFVLNYGIMSKNQIDTFKGTYKKDMVNEPSITTSLKLSEGEMNEIYAKMKEINILSFPDKFQPKSNMEQKPFDVYSLKIEFSGKEKNIYWSDENVSRSKNAVQLRDLFKRIHEIVCEKEEYKKLPEPKGGYN